MRTKGRCGAILAAAALAGCQTLASSPDPTGRADADMLRVLAAYRSSGAKPVAGLSVAQARAQPTPGDAAAVVAQQAGRPVKQPVAKVSEIEVQGAAGPLQARLYDPRPSDAASGPAPVILYFHSGWVTGTLDTNDAADRALANGTGAIVVSVRYRAAPESKFPAAQEDAAAAYAWVLGNAASFGGDGRQVALAGDSAGATLAIDTAMWARDKRMQAPVHELLITPIVGKDMGTPSYNETKDAVPLNRATVEWYVGQYTTGPADLDDPRLNVVGAADVSGLPPTTIVSAVVDPLHSEDEALARKLKAAGVPVQHRTFPGVTHGFFGMGAVVAQARLAEDFASSRLKEAFGSPASAHDAMAQDLATQPDPILRKP